MRIAIIENMKNTEHGLVGRAIMEAGAAIDIIRAYAGEHLPGDTDGYDALLVFGGEQNARDDDKHPYLSDLADLMRRFGDAGKPVLGICLGSQLLARAYGGHNLIGAAPEFGWQAIELTADGTEDPVLSAVASGFRAFQWHDDTFTLPEMAVRLARNGAVANQAFRVGKAAYGMQFHFEADRGVVENWKGYFPDVIERKAPGWHQRYAAEAATHGVAAEETGLAIARAWVNLIR